MDTGGQRGGGTYFLNLRGNQSPWSTSNHLKEQNTLNISKKLLNIIAERDAAIEERNRALLEKKKALEERESAISQRNVAIRERNEAVLERDNALSALQHSVGLPVGFGIQQGSKRSADNNQGNHTRRINSRLPYGSSSEMHILDALCKTMIESNKPPQAKSPKTNKPRRQKTAREDLNRQAAPYQLKLRNERVGQDFRLTRMDFDESIMPVPGCSCTGVLRHCYKWGNGGWQSSCCTTTMSLYPLPPVPNKRYARMGGRKMSGSVFSKLLGRLASEGYDFSIPVDLKDRWSKHGTNRYITIK